GNAVEELAPLRAPAGGQRERTRMKDHGRRPRRVRRQRQRPLAVDPHRALSLAESHALFAGQAAFEDRSANRSSVGPEFDELYWLGRAKALRRGEHVDGFEQAGLALAVVSRD